MRTDETTREAFTAVQRAFVNVSELKIEKGKILPGPPGNPGTSEESAWWFTPMIQNTGNTPTKDMHFLPIAWCAPGFSLAPAQAFGCEATPLPPTDPDNFVLERSTGHAVLGPHSLIPIGGVGTPVPTIEVRLGIAQRTTGGEWFVFGVIHYNDIFPHTREHVTKYFCSIDANNFSFGKIKPAYGLCKHWNCADDECPKDKEDYEAELQKATAKPVR